MSLETQALEAPPEKPAKKTAPEPKAGTYRFLGKNRSLLAICLILAASIHVLGLLGFGTYTLFKGSVPRMPFTSEGGVPVEDVGLEAPPQEEAPEMTEQPTMESETTPMPTDTSSEDTVLATAGLTSALPIASAPPVIAPPPTAAASSGTEKMMSRPSVRPGAKASAVNFFGVKGEGTNVYFVVDVSDSMVEQDKGGIDGYKNLKDKLGQMIQSLAPETNFNIAFYGDAVDLFTPTSVPATPENKQAAMKFLPRYMASTSQRGNVLRNYRPKIQTLPALGGTSRMDLGLAAAFEGRADTIFVLTDGKPVIRRAMDEKEREDYRKKMADAEISAADRQKYEKEMTEYRKDYEKYNEELKKYREKYADKLQEKARKEAENRAKGKGRVIEGQGFVLDPVKVPGLPEPPKAPAVPPPPARKNQGQALAAPDLGNWTDDQILEYLKETIAGTYKKDGYDLPSIHGVAFMSKSTEEKFLRSLASRNNGNFMRISAPIKDTSGN
ncbi:MAG: hypothetical protein EBZ44_04255 [Verrucomicrobia bacterium]|jgi:von Willebrand factor type A domain|nr:hypothetical protein [bacterium]NDA26151.1 hypothetical protein [Verrucomicrobiota bacterium]NDD56916.1 hypothetical protein [Verrucomicrobiota bacterium]NDD81390.1 hypothetical protein [Verrucomicrobiota bacterium]